MSLAGKVCIVTGATRGIGKGIALQLGEAGATVYITGRTLNPPSGPVGGSLTDTAREIESRGGKCIPVQCDHSKDEDIEKLFEKVKNEQSGQLDLLVNNAYSAVKDLGSAMGKPFWELPPSIWDSVNNVGLRNHYICTVYASRMMVPRRQGMIVNISSPGGLRYLFNVAYGIGKEAVDRMAADCAHELRTHNVACVSLWPGIVKTENVLHMTSQTKDPSRFGDVSNEAAMKMIENGESCEFAGKAVVNLALDRNIMTKTGKIVLTADLGNEYGFKDIDGRQISSLRQLNVILMSSRKTEWLAKYVPSFIKIPYWMMALGGSKF